MSFLTGCISGGLVAGGVYYAFSNMIASRTDMHRTDLSTLSHRLLAPPASTVPAPIPAAERIRHRPFQSLMKGRWNEQVSTIFESAADWDRRMVDWVRKTLHGGSVDGSSTSVSGSS